MIASEDFWGGSEFQSITGATLLTWGPRRKVRVLSPTVAGPTVTLFAASTIGLQVDQGKTVLIIFNASGTNSFTLVDTEATFSRSIGVNKACYVARYWNGSAWRFVLDMRDRLT